MNIDPNSITRLRDLNPVQRDILRIIYRHVKDTPVGNEWHQFDKIITYRQRRFKVRLTYRMNGLFMEISKLEQADEDELLKKPSFIHWSKGERM